MRIVLVIAISFGFIATHGILAIERKTQEPSPMPVPSAKEQEYRAFDALMQGSTDADQHPPLAPHRLPQRMNRPSTPPSLFAGAELSLAVLGVGLVGWMTLGLSTIRLRGSQKSTAG